MQAAQSAPKRVQQNPFTSLLPKDCNPRPPLVFGSTHQGTRPLQGSPAQPLRMQPPPSHSCEATYTTRNQQCTLHTPTLDHPCPQGCPLMVPYCLAGPEGPEEAAHTIVVKAEGLPPNIPVPILAELWQTCPPRWRSAAQHRYTHCTGTVWPQLTACRKPQSPLPSFIQYPPNLP